MKNDKPRKTIKLNKEVLRRLSQAQAAGIAGGISVGTCTACNETYGASCDTCDISCWGRCA